MRQLLHAITTSPETDPRVPTGLRGRPLVRVEKGALTAWATEFPDTGSTFDRRDLLEHHEIISQIHAQVEACLPARFPTWFVEEFLPRRREAILEGLERVRGRCEVAVTMVWTSPDDDVSAPVAAATPGASFLRARQHEFAVTDLRRARARELATEVQELTGSDVVEVQHHVCPSASVALSSALLVPHACAADVIGRLPRAHRDVRILINGPWPPYTFADVGVRAEEE